MANKLNQKKFNEVLKTENDCRQLLYDLKWKKGFCCRRCGNRSCWKGRTRFHARCTQCNYDESVTANTAFHRIQIPLLKAFSIVFHVTALKKGASCRNLSKILNIGVKTIWQFRRKLQNAMGACLSVELEKLYQVKHCSADGIILTHRGKYLNGLQRVNLTLEKFGSGKRTKSIRCVCTFPDVEAINPCTLSAGRYVIEGKDLLIWNFRSWLTGTHHHCSTQYLQGYLDEYCFRFNHRRNENKIWSTLISSMILLKPNNQNPTGRKDNIEGQP